MTHDHWWSCEENAVTLRLGMAQLKVEVRKPLDPHKVPDAVVSMHVDGRREAYYMVLDEATWDDFAMRLEELRRQLEDRRPLQYCRDITATKHHQMSAFVDALRRDYGETLANSINEMRPMLDIIDTRD